jgi:hypothetical protein
MHQLIAQHSYAGLSCKPTIANGYNFHKIKEIPRVTPPQLSEESGSSHVQDIEFTRESFR